MLSFLPGPLLLVINLTLFAIDAIVLGSLVVLLGIVRFLLPFKPVIRVIEKLDYFVFFVWSINTKYIILLTNKVQYHISGDKPLGPSKPCIVISNHKSWIDILMLHSVFEAKIPLTKFFMKKNLIYVPFIGLACYALGMPFLRRYPKEKILKNPELRMKDIKTTKKVCRNFVENPACLVSYVEGTRYTHKKAQQMNSPYKNLMPPKYTGLGIALSEIGNEIECMYNLTFYYPDLKKSGFLELLLGKVKHVYARIEVIKRDELPHGNYLEDQDFKNEFTQYMQDLWNAKDKILDEFKEEHRRLKETEAA